VLLAVVAYQHFSLPAGTGAVDEIAIARREEAVALAKLIAEYRLACSTLMMTDGEKPRRQPEQYRALASKLDGQLLAVEAGGDPSIIRGEAKKTFDGISETVLVDSSIPLRGAASDPKRLQQLAGK